MIHDIILLSSKRRWRTEKYSSAFPYGGGSPRQALLLCLMPVQLRQPLILEGIMLKACKYCGRIHDSKLDCGKRPTIDSVRQDNEKGRYTKAWQKKSEEIKERSKYLCSYCLFYKKISWKNLETHHIIKLRIRPDLLLEDSNLICLCQKCHKKADLGEISEEELVKIAAWRDAGSPPTL